MEDMLLAQQRYLQQQDSDSARARVPNAMFAHVIFAPVHSLVLLQIRYTEYFKQYYGYINVVDTSDEFLIVELDQDHPIFEGHRDAEDSPWSKWIESNRHSLVLDMWDIAKIATDEELTEYSMLCLMN